MPTLSRTGVLHAVSARGHSARGTLFNNVYSVIFQSVRYTKNSAIEGPHIGKCRHHSPPGPKNPILDSRRGGGGYPILSRWYPHLWMDDGDSSGCTRPHTCQQRSPAQGVQYTENGRCHWYVEASMQKRTCRRGRQWRTTEVADRVIYPVQNHQRQYGYVICWK